MGILRRRKFPGKNDHSDEVDNFETLILGFFSPFLFLLLLFLGFGKISFGLSRDETAAQYRAPRPWFQCKWRITHSQFYDRRRRSKPTSFFH